MKFLSATLALFYLLLNPSVALAASNSEITSFSNQTLSTFLIFATAAATLFLVIRYVQIFARIFMRRVNP